MSSATNKRYPPELRERAVRMVAEVQHEYPSEWAAVESVADKLGIGTAQTLLNWVRRAQTDAGERPGVTSEMAAEMRKLRAENRELKRANEILNSASVYVGDRCQVPVSSSRWISPSKTFCRPIWP
ncbi:transposase, partial [Rhodococcus sp. 27YEA6]|uniref:transposase n=1 Tax=Rhodococcus sp. 27YEA6 TaxID=3156273 RepID=UPI00383307B0